MPACQTSAVYQVIIKDLDLLIGWIFAVEKVNVFHSCWRAVFAKSNCEVSFTFLSYILYVSLSFY